MAEIIRDGSTAIPPAFYRDDDLPPPPPSDPHYREWYNHEPINEPGSPWFAYGAMAMITLAILFAVLQLTVLPIV